MSTHPTCEVAGPDRHHANRRVTNSDTSVAGER